MSSNPGHSTIPNSLIAQGKAFGQQNLHQTQVPFQVSGSQYIRNSDTYYHSNSIPLGKTQTGVEFDAEANHFDMLAKAAAATPSIPIAAGGPIEEGERGQQFYSHNPPTQHPSSESVGKYGNLTAIRNWLHRNRG